jgi:hypothetical protein
VGTEPSMVRARRGMDARMGPQLGISASSVLPL